MKNALLLIPVLVLLLTGCPRSGKQITQTASTTVDTSSRFVNDATMNTYRAAEPLTHDLLHTALDIVPDFKKRHLNGKAVIYMRPYFYATDRVTLDARGMELHRVAWIRNDGDTVNTPFNYTDDKLLITLPRIFNKSESFALFIHYTAKPDELKVGGSAAIGMDKGLYFIDPDSTDPNIPTQLWTQGETQASSAWFPTIDQPNQKMTNEIRIRVTNKFKTLSNGTLVDSQQHADGTRTDHWKMNLPHAVYLVMLAAGDFHVTGTTWRNKPVNYFIEPQFAPDANAIFGNTPEMLEFFSNRLGVEYPWDKYSQVCVREFVSGAMENTTATTHGDFVQLDRRELLDRTYEDYISHELFHQWFGDLVTCESWSNLPLNESFATYGEYLWNEHKYGKAYADHHHFDSRRGYLGEARWVGKFPLIRYSYESREDMFDSHSYNKGGQVLHMLREVLGDDAFFAGTRLFLETKKYSTAEVHDLRMAYETVTGQDLHWFFDQWFMYPGHPELYMTYQYDAVAKKQIIYIKQNQNRKKGTPLFRLPMKVDLYLDGKVERHEIVVSKEQETREIPCATAPLFVNVDATKKTLCTKTDQHAPQEWLYLYEHSDLYADKVEALMNLMPLADNRPESKQVLTLALKDKQPEIRVMAVYQLNKRATDFRETLKSMITTDASPLVRAAAMNQYELFTPQTGDDDLAERALQDSSFEVIKASLRYLMINYPGKGQAQCKSRENDTHRSMKVAVANAYASAPDEKNRLWFEHAMTKVYGRHQFQIIGLYGTFLYGISPKAIPAALPALEDLYAKSFSSATKGIIRNMLRQLRNKLDAKRNGKTIDAASEEMKDITAAVMAIDVTLKRMP
jgi:aminopeptidase N